MKNSLRALIVDDEPPARRWLRELLLAHPEVEVVGEAGEVGAGIELANRLQPDVIFLDVQMPPRTGFDLLAGLENQPRIIFVTAHDEYALRAFDSSALDYLLKPVNPTRLAESIRRLGLPPAQPPPTPVSGALTLEDLLTLREQNVFRMVAVADVAAIGAEGAYTRILIRNQTPMMILRSITEWERMLPNPPFARVDRSWMINLLNVKKVHVISRNQAQVELTRDAGELILGRTASIRLRRLLSS